MTTYYQEPYTYQMPESQRLMNEYQTCTELWLETASEYWHNRTMNAIRKLEEIGVLAPLPPPNATSPTQRSNTMIARIIRWLFGNKSGDDLDDSEVETVASNFFGNWKPRIITRDDDE